MCPRPYGVLALVACSPGASWAPGDESPRATAGREILSAAWISEPDQGNSWFGTSVSSAGDVNNDGFADLVVGAPGWTNGQAAEGAAFLYLGTPSGPREAPVWEAESDDAGALVSEDSWNSAGTSMS